MQKSPNNTLLTDIDCRTNQLATLDVSQNTQLTRLMCLSNQLTSLDISANTKLKTLSCYYNWMDQTAVDGLKNNLNYCSITSKSVVPQYTPNTTTNSGVIAPTCP